MCAAAARKSSGGGSSWIAGDGEAEESGEAESEPVYYEINDEISAHLANAGLIFGRSYNRFDIIMDIFNAEMSGIH